VGFVVALTATGCGKSTGSIKGTVSFNGVPLKGGNVTFISKDGKARSATASINEDGTYEALRVPKGDVKIIVETESLNPKNKGTFSYSPPKDQGGGTNYNPQGSQDLSKRYVQIPTRFSEEDTTPLELKVTGGAQEHPIDLK
jgi:hypothetical protein